MLMSGTKQAMPTTISIVCSSGDSQSVVVVLEELFLESVKRLISIR